MKNIKTKITESIKSEDEYIITMLEFYADSMSGVQKALFSQKAKDADSVDIVPLSEVFTPEEIASIKKSVRPKPKMCYENATKLQSVFEHAGKHDIKYVEGYLNMKGFPIEHAFNCVDDKYVDVTIELALGRNVADDTYVKIGEFDYDEVWDVLLETKYYGGIYDHIFLKKYRENVKKES